VRDEDEAIRRANGTKLGLGAAVYSASRGRAIAEQLRCGMVSVNSVLTFASVPSLPFGGVGDSGFGRIHGADGLREFARSRAMTVKRMPAPIEIASFARKPGAIKSLAAVVGPLGTVALRPSVVGSASASVGLRKRKNLTLAPVRLMRVEFGFDCARRGG
jgi:delta 1-pyrroline-5-carboxylate dehydrogenase